MPCDLDRLRIALVGPVPPPSGGMANQMAQLARLLRAERAEVAVVPVNAPYRPAWLGRLPGVRALARLGPYVAALWSTAGRVDLLHVFANSGWSWHLFAAPAIWVASLRGCPVVVNYRGGGADEFLRRAKGWVRPTLRRAEVLVVPSEFLRGVFSRYGFDARIVPNIVDAEHFAPAPPRTPPTSEILIARNLEAVYDVATGLRAFRHVLDSLPSSRLTVAGSGPEGRALQNLARTLEIDHATRFVGRVDNERMPELYRGADVVLNPSLADNMPISILEALACGVPVVSTDVGGVRHLVRHGETARLVPAGDARALADAVLLLLRDRDLASRQVAAGRSLVLDFTWPRVRERWAEVYRASRAANGGS